MVRLIAFLESDLGIRAGDEELTAENFATLRQLGELLATEAPTAPTGEFKRQVEEGVPPFFQPTTSRNAARKVFRNKMLIAGPHQGSFDNEFLIGKQRSFAVSQGNALSSILTRPVPEQWKFPGD